MQAVSKALTKENCQAVAAWDRTLVDPEELPSRPGRDDPRPMVDQGESVERNRDIWEKAMG